MPPDNFAVTGNLIDLHHRRIYGARIEVRNGHIVTLKVNGELAVKLGKPLVDDLEMLLGSDAIKLTGDGQKRQRRLQQQQLFKEAAAAEATPTEDPIALADAAMAEMEVMAE